ncbi:MAG: Na/Pi symporter [Ignavibacteriaceae bacterium]
MQRIKDFYSRYPNLFASVQLLLFLYLFFLSLGMMGGSLKLFGKDFSETLIATTTNPFIGLFIGILATSVIQSSSSTTSIVVGMVAAGALTIESAIPIVMGANIGTSITNIIASLPQIKRNNEFRRAFSAAIVHDFFNVL